MWEWLFVQPTGCWRLLKRYALYLAALTTYAGCAEQIKVSVVAEEALGSEWEIHVWLGDQPSASPDAIWPWPDGKTRSNFVIRNTERAYVRLEARAEGGSTVLARTQQWVEDASTVYLLGSCTDCALQCLSTGQCGEGPDAGVDADVGTDAGADDAGIDSGASDAEAGDANVDAPCCPAYSPCLEGACEQGECVFTPLDADGDGYAPVPAGQECDVKSGLKAGDCDDDDERVYPDQRSYFEEERKSGGWDYNCDGQETTHLPIRDGFHCDSLPVSQCEPSSSWFFLSIYFGDCGQRNYATNCLELGDSCEVGLAGEQIMARCR